MKITKSYTCDIPETNLTGKLIVKIETETPTCHTYIYRYEKVVYWHSIDQASWEMISFVRWNDEPHPHFH